MLYGGEVDVITLSRTLVLVALGEYLENNSHFHFGLDIEKDNSRVIVGRL